MNEEDISTSNGTRYDKRRKGWKKMRLAVEFSNAPALWIDYIRRKAIAVLRIFCGRRRLPFSVADTRDVGS